MSVATAAAAASDLYQAIEENGDVLVFLDNFGSSYKLCDSNAHQHHLRIGQYFENDNCLARDLPLSYLISQYLINYQDMTEVEIAEVTLLITSAAAFTILLTEKFGRTRETVIHLLLRRNHMDTVMTLSKSIITRLPVHCQHKIWNAQDILGNTHLHLVCSSGVLHLDCFHMLLSHTINICTSNIDGNTPLHLSAWMGDYRSVEQLLTKGADPNVRNTANEVPLHKACLSRNLRRRIIKWLLEACPQAVNLAAQYDKTPLHMVCANAKCSFDILEELFGHQYMPSVNAQDRQGRRPIFYICQKDTIDCDSLLLLLKHGTDIRESNDNATGASSTIDQICDRATAETSEPLEALIQFLIDPTVADRRWSSSQSSVVPSTAPEDLKPFVDALYTVRQTAPKQGRQEYSVAHLGACLNAAKLASKIGCSLFLNKCLTDTSLTQKWLLDDGKDLRDILNVAIEHEHENVLETWIDDLPADNWISSVETFSGKGAWLLIKKYPRLASKAFDKCVQTDGKGTFELRFDLLEIPDTDPATSPSQSRTGRSGRIWQSVLSMASEVIAQFEHYGSELRYTVSVHSKH